MILYAILPALFAGMYFFGYITAPLEILQPYNLSILSGAAAYVVFMSQFLLSARLPFLERKIPQDRLLALHGTAGMASATLVIIHFIIKFLMVVRYEGPALQTSLGLFALVVLLLLSPAAYFILRGRNPWRRPGSPPYARARRNHNLFALAGVGVVAHVMMASSTWSLALKGFTLAWGVLTLGAYFRHKILRPRKAARLTLAEVTGLAPNVHRYRFSDDISRSSGQFVYASFDSDVPGAEEHPFTVSSPAGSPIELTVRHSGDYTSILPRTPLGATARLDGPYGHFHPGRFPEGTPVVFLAAGIGITPVLSLARDEVLRKRYPMTLIWSIRTPADLPVGEPLRNLAAAGELEMRTIFTREAPPDEVYGRLDSEALAPFVAALEHPAWFICGPRGFGREMHRHLRQSRVPRRRIVEERFSW